MVIYVYIYLHVHVCIYIYVQIICRWKGLSILCEFSSKYCRRYTVASFSWFWLPSHFRVQESKSFWMMNLWDFHHIGSDGANRGEYGILDNQNTINFFQKAGSLTLDHLRDDSLPFVYHVFVHNKQTSQMFSFSGQAGAVFEVGILDDFLRRDDTANGKRRIITSDLNWSSWVLGSCYMLSLERNCIQVGQGKHSKLFVFLDIEDKSQKCGIFGSQLGIIVVVVSRSQYELFSGRADTPDS